MILINPLTQKLGDFYRYLPLSPPIGIGVLTAYLLAKQKTAKILDEHVTLISDELLEDYVKDLSRPYIFGISCLTPGVSRTYELAKIIKTKYPDSKVIVGGIHPTALPEEFLNTGFVDIVVRGEGEETLNLLYAAIKGGSDYSKLPGISFKDNNYIVHNPAARIIPDLNLLPSFPYHLFERHSDRYDLGFITSSRGCPYDCIFCSQRLISGRLYRYLAPEKISERLELLINRYNQRNVVFLDDNFTANKKRTKELCSLMYRNNFYKKAKFHCQVRGDAVDADLLSYMKLAGFRYIDFGLETASERLMKLLNKGETVEENIKAVKLTKKFGFLVAATFILGLPTETKEERWQTYNLAKRLKIDYARFNVATPYPGTRLLEIARKENRLNIDKNWANINACGALVEGYFSKTNLPYVPNTTTEEELRKDIFKANLYFYLRPKSVFKVFKEGLIPGGWFLLPKRWYLKPKEWYHIIRLMVRTLLPRK